MIYGLLSILEKIRILQISWIHILMIGPELPRTQKYRYSSLLQKAHWCIIEKEIM